MNQEHTGTRTAVPARLARLNRIWVAWASAAILAHAIVVLARLAPANNDFARWDYTGAMSLRIEGNPYTWSCPDAGLLPYHYPPLMAYLCYPLASFSVLTAAHVWAVANLLLTGVLAWQIVTLLVPDRFPSPTAHAKAWLCVWGLLTCYCPQVIGNALGQKHNLVAILVLGGLLSLRANNVVRAGIWVGTAALLKIFPGALIVALLAGRRYRAVLSTFAVCLLFALVTWQSTAYYLSSGILFGAPHKVAERQHYTDVLAGQHYVGLPGMADRLLTANDYSIPLANSRILRNGFLVIVSAVIVVPLGTLCLRRPRVEILFVTVLTATMLLLPAIGYYHLNLAVVVAVTCYRVLLDVRERKLLEPGLTPAAESLRPWTTTALVTAVVLTAIPVNYGLSNEIGVGWLSALYGLLHTRWGVLWLTPQTYGLIMLFAVCIQLGFARTNPTDLS